MTIKSIVIFILFSSIVLFILLNNNKTQETFQNNEYAPYISFDNEISSGIQNIEYKYIKGETGDKGDPGNNATDQNIVSYLDEVFNYVAPTTTTLAPTTTTTTLSPVPINKTFFIAGVPKSDSLGIAIGTIDLPLNYEIGITIKRTEENISTSKAEYRFIAGIHDGSTSNKSCSLIDIIACQFGERVPLIYLMPGSFRVHIVYGTNEDNVYQNKYFNTINDLVLNENTDIKIKFYEYYVEIFINETLVHFAYRQSRTFDNANVYSFQNPLDDHNNKPDSISEEVEISNFYFRPIDNPETEKIKNFNSISNTNTFSSYIYSPTHNMYINGFGQIDNAIGYMFKQHAAFGANIYNNGQLNAASQDDRDKLGHFITLVLNEDNTISFKTKDSNYLKIKYEEIGLNDDGTPSESFGFTTLVSSIYGEQQHSWHKHKIEYVNEGKIRIYNENNTTEKRKYYLVLSGPSNKVLTWQLENDTSDSGLFTINNTRPLFENCVLYNPSRNKYLDGASGLFSNTEKRIALLCTYRHFTFRKNNGKHLRIPHEENYTNNDYNGSSKDYIGSQFTHLVRNWNHFQKIEHLDGTVSFFSEYSESGRYYLGVASDSNNFIFYHSTKYNEDPSNCKFEITYNL